MCGCGRSKANLKWLLKKKLFVWVVIQLVVIVLIKCLITVEKEHWQVCARVVQMYLLSCHVTGGFYGVVEACFLPTVALSQPIFIKSVTLAVGRCMLGGMYCVLIVAVILVMVVHYRDW